MNIGIDQIMHAPVMTGTPHQTKGHCRQVMAEHRVSAFRSSMETTSRLAS